MAFLPIDALMPDVERCIAAGSNFVLTAEPGAGKTTRVPPACMRAVNGEVWVLEPRRLAARMAATRVAGELGEPLGVTVGYQVRFEDVTGPRTRLRFMTEGVLTRRIIAQPDLRKVSVVILDEFHERHLEADFALALLRRLQVTTRPDLRIAVMSATLQAGSVAEFLGDCPVLQSKGRMFPVEIRYAPPAARTEEEGVATSVTQVLQQKAEGDVLVFLAGSAEIRRSIAATETLGGGKMADLLPLFGDLDPAEQDRAVRPGARRKVIFSTNVAESSLTIEGVNVVIDGGWARVASDSVATGLPVLELRRISQASAVQRAGRAGRLGPGEAIRLYTPEDFARRPAFDTPEIRRRDLSPVLLTLRVLGIDSLQWFDAPASEALTAASDLLERLSGGYRAADLAKFPLHPRLSKLLLEASKRRCGALACSVAARLSSRERYPSSDVLTLTDHEPGWAVRATENQLRRFLPKSAWTGGSDEDLLMSLLSAFPDRVVKRTSAREGRMVNGRTVSLPQEHGPDFLVALDVEDRKEAGLPKVKLAGQMEPEWLIDLFPERLRDKTELFWNRTAERVEQSRQLIFEDLTITEDRQPAPASPQTGELLWERVMDTGVENFMDQAEIGALQARVSFAAAHSPIPALTNAEITECLKRLCSDLRSFSEVRQVAGSLRGELLNRLGPKHARLLEELAPERLQVNKRSVPVHYRPDQPPFIASRLQDFFGTRETPRIARGQVAVVVHLLAPNGRPVQMTSDLSGFWTRLYPQVRKELSRRYPRHAWPENPV